MFMLPPCVHAEQTRPTHQLHVFTLVHLAVHLSTGIIIISGSIYYWFPILARSQVCINVRLDVGIILHSWKIKSVMDFLNDGYIILNKKPPHHTNKHRCAYIIDESMSEGSSFFLRTADMDHYTHRCQCPNNYSSIRAAVHKYLLNNE